MAAHCSPDTGRMHGFLTRIMHKKTPAGVEKPANGVRWPLEGAEGIDRMAKNWHNPGLGAISAPTFF
jgi:hypothetical protein